MKRKLLNFFVLFSVLLFLFPKNSGAEILSAETVLQTDYFKTVSRWVEKSYDGQLAEGQLYRAALEAMTAVDKRNMGEEPSREQLIEAGLRGMLNSLDPYTTYFSPEEAENFFGEMEGEYGGIGAELAKIDDTILITEVFPQSPAEKAGLIPGDRILKLDGQMVDQISLDNAVNMIKGKVGTRVELEVLRPGSREAVLKSVVRQKIRISPVTWEIKDDLGYMKVDLFNSQIEDSSIQALTEFDQKGIDRIIIDLRDNPGGDVEQAVFLAQRFVPKGLITRLDFKDEAKKDLKYFSQLDSSKYRFAVLVNGMTASASEIFAGAVQDSKAGSLIGTTTYGKSKVQNIIPLLTPQAFAKYQRQLGLAIVDAYELIDQQRIQINKEEIQGWIKITTGEYLTPKGRRIDQVGLIPDFIVAEQGLGGELHRLKKLSKTGKPALGQQSIEVYRAETILGVAGYQVDRADTFLDPKTFFAIKRFQQEEGLFPYGVLDFSTQQALNNKLEELILKYDQPYARAVDLIKD